LDRRDGQEPFKISTAGIHQRLQSISVQLAHSPEMARQMTIDNEITEHSLFKT
jgi:hypothetical protein